MSRFLMMVVAAGGLLSFAPSAHAEDFTARWNAQLRERQQHMEHDAAVARREAARNAPLAIRGKLMEQANHDRTNALIGIAHARYDQGKSNWSTQYRGLEYQQPKPPVRSFVTGTYRGVVNHH